MMEISWIDEKEEPVEKTPPLHSIDIIFSDGSRLNFKRGSNITYQMNAIIFINNIRETMEIIPYFNVREIKVY